MSRGMKLGLVGGVIVLVIGAVVVMGAQKRKNAATEVRLEAVGRRDLVSTVTASGTIMPRTSVDVSADITGRITQIAVREGDRVTKGQFLLQIDPAQYRAAVSRAEALVASNQSALAQAKANLDQAERALARSRELSQTSPNLVSAESVEQAQTAFDVARANYTASEAQVAQSRATLQEARDNLAKTRLVAPMDGQVVRLNVEEGEVAVPGTFSRETALLMTIADMSEILAEVKVDETDVVRLSMGDSVEVTIDAFPDTTFVGRVTKISNSAQLTATATASGSQDRAVDFETEVTILNPPADIRPDLSATARIVTATRDDALSIPIISLTVREHETVPNENRPEATTASATPAASSSADTGAAARRKAAAEREGVFVVTNGVAQFRPVRVGIAGEEYFEVLEGVRQGDTIVAGPYQAIRDLKDSTKVKQAMAGGPETEE